MTIEKAYYHAPDFLEHIITLGDPGAGWDFYDLLIARDTRDGTYWGSTDSGCSCPSPFESHTFPTDFVEIRSADDVESLAKDGPWTRADIDNAIKLLGF